MRHGLGKKDCREESRYCRLHIQQVISPISLPAYFYQDRKVSDMKVRHQIQRL